MDTTFINTKNSKATEPHRFRLYFTDKLDLRKKQDSSFSQFVNLLHMEKYKISKTSLKYQNQLGMKLLIYQMVLRQSQTFKIIF